MQHTPGIAVITATTGRAQLERAIATVAQQTHPCTHYVFVDGAPYHAAAHAVLSRHPHVRAIYLPENTGANRWYNSHINAASAFLVQEDIHCFLDDDNGYRSDHIAGILATFAEHPADFVYSLRNFALPNGTILARDDFESLGAWTTPEREPLVDVNCYALRRDTARRIAHAWCRRGWGNDTEIYRELLNQHCTGSCTGRYSVYYTINPAVISPDGWQKICAAYAADHEREAAFARLINNFSAANIQRHGGRPWAQE